MIKLIPTILILEDNLSFKLELEMMLEEMEYQMIASTNNPQHVLEIINSNEIDLILMNMSIKLALQNTVIGKKIEQFNIPTLLMTAGVDIKKYQSFKTANTIGFFIKPIHPFTLESTIDFALHPSKNIFEKQYSQTNNLFSDSIFVKNGHKNYKKIPIQNIQCLEASGNYTYIHTSNEKYISTLKFKELEDIFSQKGFVKVHRSFIINANYISSMNMEENIMQLENSNTIPFSRTYKQSLLDEIKRKII